MFGGGGQEDNMFSALIICIIILWIDLFLTSLSIIINLNAFDAILMLFLHVVF